MKETVDSVLRKEEVTAKTVFDAVKAGDPLAMEILTNKNKDNTLVVVECIKNKLKVKLKSSKTDSKRKEEKESVAVNGTSGRKLEF